MYAVLGRLFLVVYLIGIGAKLKECQDEGKWPYGPWSTVSDAISEKRKSASARAPSPASASDSIDKEKPNV